jgi:hypothetical protein
VEEFVKFGGNVLNNVNFDYLCGVF